MASLKTLDSPPVRTGRDALFFRVGPGRLMAFTCDAAGGIGAKPHDRVRVHPQLVGKLTARVALMELLAVGADPKIIAGTFSVERNPTGKQLLEGVKEEVRNARLRGVRILCSSEKNVRVGETGVGITAAGLLADSDVMIGRCKDGDELLAVGLPLVGREVVGAEMNRKVAETLDVIRLRKNLFVRELIPVGSGGILYEAGVIARDSCLSFRPFTLRVDLEKSAGPATVLLLAVRNGGFEKVRRIVRRKPLTRVGVLLKNQPGTDRM